MPSFNLPLINEKKRLYDRFAVFLTVINAAAILGLLILQKKSVLQTATGLLTILLLLTAIIVSLRQPQHAKRNLLLAAAAASTVCFWILAGYWWAALVTALLSVLYLYSRKLPVVTVNEQQVSYPSLPPRTFYWPAISNILLRDGLLTIDLKNNRLIQQTIDEKINTVNEQVFNEFCRQQLHKNQGS